MTKGYCCVYGCKNRNGHTFPKEKLMRSRWIAAVKRDNFVPSKYSIVCKCHFVDSDYHQGVYSKHGTERIRRIIKRDAVPSVFFWKKEPSTTQTSRARRQANRQETQQKKAAKEWVEQEKERKKKIIYYDFDFQVSEEISIQSDMTDSGLPIVMEEESQCLVSSTAVASLGEIHTDNVGCAIQSESTEIPVVPITVRSKSVITLSSDSESEKHEDHQTSSSLDTTTCSDASYLFPTADVIHERNSVHHTANGQADIQNFKADPCQMKQRYLSVESIKHSDKLVHFYTGLENFDVFMHAFWSLGDNVNYLVYAYSDTCSCLSPVNQFLLMLVKLRRYYPHFELARMFDVSEFTVQNIFITWINFCYRQWKEVDWWPMRSLVSYHCPADFKKKFPSTRVILDATEIRVKQPSNPRAQRASFSSYKHANTMKVLVGVTPGGLTSFVSEAYGGSSSDRQLVERTTLCKLCDPHDSIMADKGFNVQDIFAAHDVHINIPAFFKQKNRLAPSVRQNDKKIASKRVHVERIIGMAKVFTICQHRLNNLETKLATEIINVCFFLCNFRKTIISRFA